MSEQDRQRVLQLFEAETEQKQRWILASCDRLRMWIDWAARVLGIYISPFGPFGMDFGDFV